ncbi:MAG: zinc ribbon domain-containing protein [Streptosporangiaceae bacterium]
MPPVKADPEAQLRLLDLQELDTALDRLAHRRRALPELAEIESMTARARQLRDAVVVAETETGDIAREQSKAEADVDQVRRRTERDQGRLDSGQVSSPRELENLQSEIASLARRQSDLEDVALEIMERREETEGRRDRFVRERDDIAERLAEAEGRRDKAFEEIGAEVASTRDRRAAIAAKLPDDLVRLYERIREQRDGVGAAPLQGGSCGGCRLALNTVEVQRIRSAPPDEVVRCEECRRILVRTSGSEL